MGTKAKTTSPDIRSMDILVSDIREQDGFNHRSDLGDLDELCASIQAHGLYHPLTVCHDPGKGYALVAGARRLAAIRRLGIPRVPCRLIEHLDIGSPDAVAIAMEENEVRLAISPLDIARAYQRLVEAEKGKTINARADAVAARLGRSGTTVLRFLRLLDAPESIRARLERGEVTPAAVEAVMSVPADVRQRVADRLSSVPAGEVSTRVVHQAAREVAEDAVEPQEAPEPTMPVAGNRVRHPLFGDGTVEEVRGPKEGRSLVIAFDTQGEKELQWSFCMGKLQRIDGDGFEPPARKPRAEGRAKVILWRGKREVREEMERLVAEVRAAKPDSVPSFGANRALAALMWVSGMVDSATSCDSRDFRRAFDEIADELEERKREDASASEEE